MSAARGAALLFGATVAAVAFGASAAGCKGARDPGAAGADPAASAMCAAVGPLDDLGAAMSPDLELGAASPVVYLVDADDELASLAVVKARLQGISTPEARQLATSLDRLGTVLEARRGQLAAKLARTRTSYAAAEAALESAAVCKRVDLRDPARTVDPGASKAARAKERARERPLDEADSKVRKANLATLASKACEPSVRLWATAKNADLMSPVSAAAVASHMFELDLDKERAALRDELARALKQEAEDLRALHALGAPRREEQDEDARALVTLRAEISQSLQTIEHGCLASMRVSDHVVGSNPEPRRATVNVRPRWSGALERLAGGVEQFGSGFLVRWRGASGAMETRVITNNHVMGGAFEAEIVSGEGDAAADRVDAGAPASQGSSASKKPKTWTATLLHADPHEDVAILRLDPETESVDAFRQGLSFRMTPAREQEPVVAAGFPGVGVRPSFQVSKGIVSNAKFGADAPGTELGVAYVQHTAPIDPGNSGGPLLDGDGHLLGMNTLKIVGRENVGLAIPTARIQAAMVRGEEHPALTARHAEASCNAVLAALSAPAPSLALMSRFGLRLFEATENDRTRSQTVAYRDAVRGTAQNPVDLARVRAYGATRALIEEEGGVGPFDTCASLSPLSPAAADAGKPPRARFRATLKAGDHEHEMIFEDEAGLIRLVELK